MNDVDFAQFSNVAQTIMDWTRTVGVITTNGSQKVNSGSIHILLCMISTDYSPKYSKRDRRGKMFAAGWHASMEKGKTVVHYAPRPGMVDE